MSKPTICFVGLENLPVLSRSYNQHAIGGEQVQHTLLARALVKRGYTVSMVVADYGQADGELIDGIKLFRACGLTEGVPIVRFIHPRMTKLWAALKRANSDVYYVSCAGPQLGIVVLFGKLNKKRVVFRIAHDTDCDPRELLIRFWRDKKIYEYGLRRVNTILAQSDQQARALLANYALASKVATMLVEPSSRDIAFLERDIDVLWVNNIRPFKRADLALELARRLPEVKFHMIGGPQGGHEVLYDEICEQSKQVRNLVFHGRVPYHDVNDFYERAKVFVNTSDSEGFPNSYLQAWRRGTPTVVFFDPDSVVSKEGLGAAVTAMDDMVLEVKRLMTSVKSWADVSSRCKRFMESNYGESNVLAPYIETIDV